MSMLASQEYDKYELINGKEVMMSPASMNHLRIQGNLYAILWNYLRKKRCNVYSEAKVVFNETTWYIPDLLILCDKNKERKNHIEGAPDLVIEILSPATRKRDIGIKKDTYEKYGVREYWLVDPMSKTIEVYLLRDGKFNLDNSYHDYDEEDWEALSDEEKAETKLALKVSLYDDLEIDIREIFREKLF